MLMARYTREGGEQYTTSIRKIININMRKRKNKITFLFINYEATAKVSEQTCHLPLIHLFLAYAITELRISCVTGFLILLLPCF